MSTGSNRLAIDEANARQEERVRQKRALQLPVPTTRLRRSFRRHSGGLVDADERPLLEAHAVSGHVLVQREALNPRPSRCLPPRRGMHGSTGGRTSIHSGCSRISRCPGGGSRPRKPTRQSVLLIDRSPPFISANGWPHRNGSRAAGLKPRSLVEVEVVPTDPVRPVRRGRNFRDPRPPKPLKRLEMRCRTFDGANR